MSSKTAADRQSCPVGVLRISNCLKMASSTEVDIGARIAPQAKAALLSTPKIFATPRPEHTASPWPTTATAKPRLPTCEAVRGLGDRPRIYAVLCSGSRSCLHEHGNVHLKPSFHHHEKEPDLSRVPSAGFGDCHWGVARSTIANSPPRPA